MSNALPYDRPTAGRDFGSSGGEASSASATAVNALSFALDSSQRRLVSQCSGQAGNSVADAGLVAAAAEAAAAALSLQVAKPPSWLAGLTP